MAPPRNDDGMMLLINSINEQVKRISEAQEQLRNYLLAQIDELRATIIRREEYRDNLDSIKREVMAQGLRTDKLETTLTEKIDKLEDSLTVKIEKVGTDAKAQQEANYKTIIKVQASILGTIAVTVIGIAVKLFLPK
jgi:hypothetical protein